MKYLFICLFFVACNNIGPKRVTPPISTEVLDTINIVPPKVTAVPLVFETAFVKGTKQKVKDSDFTLYGITIGKIKIPSGRIAVCDPMHIDEYGIPFTQAFPIGELPVQLSIAKFGPEELTAFARINFSDEPVTRWEVAVQKAQVPIPVGGEEMYGYGVDGGVAIFIDEASTKVLDNSTVENMEGKVFKDMLKHYHDMWKYTMYEFGGHNLAAFSTGLGDGRYETYIGFDAMGKPCRLLTDFNLFKWK